MKNQSGFNAIELVTVVLVLAVVGGWIANIVKLVGMDWNQAVNMWMIMRGLGIWLFPVGAVLGYL